MARRRLRTAVGLLVTFALLAGTGAWGFDTPRRRDAVVAENPAAENVPRPATLDELAMGPDGGRDLRAPQGSSLVVEGGSLENALGAAGYTLPSGSHVYVAKVLAGSEGVATYVTYEAGGGARDTSLWPASSVKLLAALGALAYLRTLGFTGAAVVETEDWSATVSDLYDEAIRFSSNDAYDRLVEISGVDWLNEVFLTPENGFIETVIQRSYSSGDVISSPAMTLSEGERTVVLPPRAPAVELGVLDAGNQSDLAEMVDSVRLVMLDSELPESERLDVEPTDLAAMADALLGAEGFLEPGVANALGGDALVYNKPGWVAGESCIDVGLVVDATADQRFLVGIATPDEGTECGDVATIAEVVLSSLSHP